MISRGDRRAAGRAAHPRRRERNGRRARTRGGRPTSRPSRDEPAEIVAVAMSRDLREDRPARARRHREQREHGVPSARHRQTLHGERRDDAREMTSDMIANASRSKAMRRGDGGGDAVVEEHDLERLTGDAADGEEADRVGGEPHAKQGARTLAACGRETPCTSPTCAEMPARALARAPAGNASPSRRTSSMVVDEVDVAEGDEEEQGADGDGHQRDQLRNGAGHLPALIPRPDCRALVGLYGLVGVVALVATSSMSGVDSSSRSSTA